MTILDDNGRVLWRFAGGDIAAWQIGKLRDLLRRIQPEWSDEEIERQILRYFIPDDYVAEIRRARGGAR